MRMLVLADTEPEWGAIPEAVTTHQADIVVTAGDLNETWLRRAQLTEVSVPTYGVYGNHCNGSYLDTLGVTNLHLNRVEVDGTSFVGLEGCVRYKRRGRDILYTQAEYAEMVAYLPAADVLVTHCPRPASTITPTRPMLASPHYATGSTPTAHCSSSTGTPIPKARYAAIDPAGLSTSEVPPS